MATNSETLKHGLWKHGWWAAALTAATLLGSVFLFRLLKSNLDADFMQRLPRSLRPLSSAQD